MITRSGLNTVTLAAADIANNPIHAIFGTLLRSTSAGWTTFSVLAAIFQSRTLVRVATYSLIFLMDRTSYISHRSSKTCSFTLFCTTVARCAALRIVVTIFIRAAWLAVASSDVLFLICWTADHTKTSILAGLCTLFHSAATSHTTFAEIAAVFNICWKFYD